MFPIHATMLNGGDPRIPILIWAFIAVADEIKAVVERVDDHSFQEVDLYEIERKPTTKGL